MQVFLKMPSRYQASKRMERLWTAVRLPGEFLSRHAAPQGRRLGGGDGDGLCSSLRTSCGSCYAAGCRYCEVGPVEWTTGPREQNTAAQGDSLDYACILTDGWNGMAGGCEDLTVLRGTTAYARTVPEDECMTVVRSVFSQPPREVVNETVAPTQRPVLSKDGSECGVFGVCDTWMLIVTPLAVIAVGILASMAFLWFWRRCCKPNTVRVSPAPQAVPAASWKQQQLQAGQYHGGASTGKTTPSSISKVDHSKWAAATYPGLLDNPQTMPPLVHSGTSAALTASPVPVGGATFAAAVAEPEEEQLLWDFQEGGVFSVKQIEVTRRALAESEAADRQQSAQKQPPRRRCLAFCKANGLAAEQLASLGKLLDAHPATSVSLGADWRHASDNTLRALAALLHRRGRCLLRTSSVSSQSGPLRLPSRLASLQALADVAEAVASGAHAEVGALVCQPPEAPDLETNAISFNVDAVRNCSTHLAQKAVKLSDLGVALACGFFNGRAGILQVVKLNSCEIGDLGCQAVARLLEPAGESLKELSLSANKIGDKGVAAIAEKLHMCDSLERLLLDRNSISTKGVQALAQRLPRSELQELVLGTHLGGNPMVGDAGAEALAAALDDELPRAAANRGGRLERLSLEDCGIGDRGALAFAAKLPKSAITTLSLARGSITDETAHLVLNAMPVQAVALDLAGNSLTDATGMLVVDLLGMRPKLAISLASNRLSSTLISLLQESLGTRLRV
eukprot:TRINITY_DN23488_c0_g1_i3.p1 TRINITY_DN23488_c0_g1~~TRINITY_DN23488_c0_g1_i3.p1  ORF type:complete len:737 (-),score=113.63 TRINITY_DN23488_c0_g1_i3:111-2321(-)